MLSMTSLSLVAPKLFPFVEDIADIGKPTRYNTWFLITNVKPITPSLELTSFLNADPGKPLTPQHLRNSFGYAIPIHSHQ